jgi:hypothetical protein
VRDCGAPHKRRAGSNVLAQALQYNATLAATAGNPHAPPLRVDAHGAAAMSVTLKALAQWNAQLAADNDAYRLQASSDAALHA